MSKKSKKLDPETQAMVDAVSLKSMTVENGNVDLTMTDEMSNGLILAMAEAMAFMLDKHEATNYIEMECRPAKGGKLKSSYTMTLRRAEKPTPHELRQQADAEVARLKAAMRPCATCEHPLHVHVANFCRTRIDSACSCGCDGIDG